MAKAADLVDRMPDNLEGVLKGDDSGTDKPADSAGGADADKPEGSVDGGAGASDADQFDKGGADELAKGSEADPAGDKAAGDGENDGYIADEAVEPDEEPPAKEEPKPATPESQYIFDNLPELSVRGKQGDGAIKTFKVKIADQLTEDFEFASKHEELLFNQSLAGQEATARELQSKFRREQATKSATEFTEKENKDIRAGISSLQREGLLPKFKREASDPKFADDPGVKEAQGVIDYMNRANADFLRQANNGGVLYHMDFETAYWKLQATKPKAKVETAQDKEDKERVGVARQAAGAQGAPSAAVGKVKPYRSMRDLIDSLDVREF